MTSRARSRSARDGDLLATGRYDGRVQLWSTETGGRVGPPLEGHDGRDPVAQLQPRTAGHSRAAARTGRFCCETSRPSGRSDRALPVDPGKFVAAMFSRDGSQLFAVSSGDRAVRLDTTVDAWKRHACAVAGRELTEDEWDDVLPDRTYTPVCDA